ncbi:MAG: NADH-quinone oxidoreductase subunit NuoE [Deltaproteobacteria bacterium]|nr:NADH-quinone oxidoreductase subunit NuoE [Candidatus Anaeroferrophillacea bacterium]
MNDTAYAAERQPDPEEEQVLAVIETEIPALPRDEHQLIPSLQGIQNRHGYLPRGGLVMVARHFGLPASKVYGVATFYNQFRFNPPGRHPIKVCLGTACHVRGGDIVLENFERKLGIVEGETTADREFSLERVACVGCCALAPVVLVGEKVEAHVTPSKVEGVVTQVEIENEMAVRAAEREEQCHGKTD